MNTLPGLSRLLERPDQYWPTQEVGQLIKDGLTEDELINAGQRNGLVLPKMELALTDLNTILGYLGRISLQLNTDYPNSCKIFAARDAKTLYDDYVTRYPDDECTLLPASQDLWKYPTPWEPSEMDKLPELTKDFLAGHGLSENKVKDPNTKFVVIDTGYRGNVGVWLDETFGKLYGVHSLMFKDRLDIKLVGVDAKLTYGRKILDLPAEENDMLRSQQLPRMFDWHGYAIQSGSRFDDPCYRLATAMQMLPQPHYAYHRLQRDQDGRVQAIPRDPRYYDETYDIDEPGLSYTLNPNVVSPLAAAIVQYRVVKNAVGN